MCLKVLSRTYVVMINAKSRVVTPKLGTHGPGRLQPHRRGIIISPFSSTSSYIVSQQEVIYRFNSPLLCTRMSEASSSAVVLLTTPPESVPGYQQRQDTEVSSPFPSQTILFSFNDDADSVDSLSHVPLPNVGQNPTFE